LSGIQAAGVQTVPQVVVPELVGYGLGGHALTLCIQAAWNSVDDDLAPVRRAWLHTSSLDHPRAHANYLARGFRPFWTRTGWREITSAP
jgi:hypothetical protein